jgi:hypothetical protein
MTVIKPTGGTRIGLISPTIQSDELTREQIERRMDEVARKFQEF